MALSAWSRPRPKSWIDVVQGSVNIASQMNRIHRRIAAALLLFVLAFQLGVAAAMSPPGDDCGSHCKHAGMVDQSKAAHPCCRQQSGATATIALPTDGVASAWSSALPQPSDALSCLDCGTQCQSTSPFVLPEQMQMPTGTAIFVATDARSAPLPSPAPSRLERPPSLAAL